jgi:hypothetical protein
MVCQSSSVAGVFEAESGEPVAANDGADEGEQDGFTAQKREGVQVAFIGDDLLAPLGVIGEQLLEVGRVAVNGIVETDDDAVLDGFARAAGAAVQPIELHHIRVLAGGDEQVELVLLLLQRWMLEVQMDASALFQLDVTGHFAEALHARSDIG